MENNDWNLRRITEPHETWSAVSRLTRPAALSSASGAKTPATLKVGGFRSGAGIIQVAGADFWHLCLPLLQIGLDPTHSPTKCSSFLARIVL